MYEAAPEEDFGSLSLEDRLAHKQWKARTAAYEELILAFKATADEDDAIFRQFIHNPDLLKKAVTDSNAVAQEKGIECACSFVQWAGKNAARTAETVLPATVEKCLGSTRAGTKAKAIELCLLYTQVEDSAETAVVQPLYFLFVHYCILMLCR